MQTVNRYCKLFNLGKHEGKYEKATFYTELESLHASSVQYPVVISEIEPLYNKVSAYMKRKDYIKGKMLVKFDCSTLAKGWNSSAFIVIKDNKFYVVIDNGIDEEDWLRVKKDTDASRVVYSQQKMDFKNFPRLFLFSKGDNEAPAVQQYGLPINNVKTEYLYYRSLSQSRKKAYLEVHKDFQTRLIKYYMTCITRHESTKPYSATLKKAWKNPEEYQNLQEFYDDCDCCYSLSSESINLSELINLSRERKAFVFQLYNKDFAEKAHGKENLHTMYWRELFSPENLKDVVFKLSSEGTELFYRAKHEGRQTVHKKGEFVVNKVLKNGNPIPNDVFLLYKQNLRNGVIDLSNVHVDENDEKAKKTLTNAKNLLAEDFVKEPHQLNVDIQKNARFYRHEMQIHIPIRINFGCKGAYLSKFNEYTLQQLRKHKDELNIIGIDRGERNLIYVSVLDQKGNMLEPPHSFNIIESENYDNFVRRYDYLSKLKEVEINRDKQRKSWDAIENIKQLKSGYLSMVVHEISKMMVKHHAIIIMENLNWGFKKGRFSVERQVYQKFEEALINKLSYLAFKSGSPSPEYGNIRNGLQLAVPVKSLKDVRTQCGWLFYVPAGYTSKIDPATGFANLFSMTNAKANPRQFFENFEKIEYRNGAYHFTFDYSKTDSDGRKVFPVTQTDYINQWTVSSYGERIQIQRNKDNGSYTPVHINLTDELDKLLADKKIDRNGLSLEKIKSCEDDDFFSKLFYYFSLILQMRNSEPGNVEVDYLISPVVRDGRQFKSYDAANNNGIKDADANGAYHIALKGLYLLRNDFPEDGINNEKWFEFTQTKPYLKD